MFGLLQSRIMCTAFYRFVEDELPVSLEPWYSKMIHSCKFEDREYIA